MVRTATVYGSIDQVLLNTAASIEVLFLALFTFPRNDIEDVYFV